ncbi:MAG: hypothetical protein HY922_09425 [Elusimicrobia bacterium]|nr:hypothetical protein [Elusimicrobiota bacterium]
MAESGVKSLIWNKDVRLTQHQYEALVVFLFNMGNTSDVRKSKMFVKLNTLDYDGVLKEWMEFNGVLVTDPGTGKREKVVLHGLERRRRAEQALWDRR